MDIDLRSIEVTDNPDENRFEAHVGEQLAVLDYRRAGEKLILTHTEVPPAAREQGVGSKVVKAALDEARSKGVQVVPHCPFVQHYIEEHPEYQSLIAE